MTEKVRDSQPAAPETFGNPNHDYVFDAETDGLLHQCTRMWILTLHDLQTGEKFVYLEGQLGWQDKMRNARRVIGHNIVNFDLMMFRKLFGFKLPRSVKVVDTMIFSLVLDYKRFGNNGHSMAAWGEYLGKPKVEHEDWSRYSPEMRNRNITDVDLNIDIYKQLMDEFKAVHKNQPLIKTYIEAEHYAAEWSAVAGLEGWPFNLEKAKELMEKLDHEKELAYNALSSILGTKTVAPDKVKGEVAVKRPRWVKSGCYDAHTSSYFGVDPWSGFEGESRPIEGEYCRVSFEKLSLDSIDDVKVFLFRNGWVPTEWNLKKRIDEETGRIEFTKTSPKITEDSLEFLGGDGKLYSNFLTAKARSSIVKTWIENTDENGNLHGDCFVIGTPSMRARHSIIVNVPSTDSAWGPEMRSLFRCKPGWKLIGCDSAGNQARGLAHCIADPAFIDLLLNGDIHQHNADILTRAVHKIAKKRLKVNPVPIVSSDFKVPRSAAKRILYAFLFGASGAKMWSYIFGSPEPLLGKMLKDEFMKAVPGFPELMKGLKQSYELSKDSGDLAHIRTRHGVKLYVDSPHKLLVYLLQAIEKATCSAAIMLTMQRLEKANIPYVPCIFMHDEEDFQVPEEFAEEAARIGKQAFVDGPKLMGIEIMDGEAKIGNTWYDVH